MSDSATILEFGSVALQSPFRTTANNTVAGFGLNRLVFNPTAGVSFSITGSALDFKPNGSTLPTLVQNSNQNQTISGGIIIEELLTLSGNGTGVVSMEEAP